MNARIVLVEGASNTGKSTLLKNLLGKHVREQHIPGTLLHLSQTHTFFPRFTAPEAGMLSGGGSEFTESAPGEPPAMGGECPAGALGNTGPSAGAAPGKRQHRDHLRKILRLIDWGAWAGQPGGAFFCLIDTLHLTQQLQPGLLSWAELTYVDRALAELGCKLVVLQRNKVSAEQQQIRRIAELSILDKIYLPAEDGLAQNVEKAYAFWMGG